MWGGRSLERYSDSWMEEGEARWAGGGVHSYLGEISQVKRKLFIINGRRARARFHVRRALRAAVTLAHCQAHAEGARPPCERQTRLSRSDTALAAPRCPWRFCCYPPPLGNQSRHTPLL